MKKNLILFALFLLLTFSLYSQNPPDTLWTRTFGGSELDWGHSVQQTTDGGYVIAGITYSFGAGSFDMWLIKTDENGYEEWNQTFGGSSYDAGHTIQQTIDGGYIISGFTYSFGAGENDVWIIKTDANGNEEWNQTYGGALNEIATTIIQTNDGGYIICGSTNSFGAGESDIWLIKIDENGNEEWNQTYGGVETEFGESVLQSTDGGYIIVGHTESFGAGESDIWLIKTDENGYEEWDQTFGESLLDLGTSIIQTTDGGYIISGATRSYNADEVDALIIKTDENGNEEWLQTYGGVFDDTALSIIQTEDGGYSFAGGTDSFGAGDKDIWLVKIDENGNEEWDKTFGGNLQDYLFQLQKTNDNDYVIIGSTSSFGNPAGDVWLLKIGYVLNVDFSANPIFGYSPLDVSFSDESTGNIISWEWDFQNDGAIDSYLQNPNFTYFEAGYYSVSLTVNDGLNTDTEIKENYIGVEGPTTDFSANITEGFVPMDVQFTDTSFGNIISWEWDFQNDGVIDSYIQNPMFTYNSTGIYSVALTVSDGTNEDTLIIEDYIAVQDPLDADFEADVNEGDVPLEVHFNDLSTGDILGWLWDFDNDGTIDSNQQNPIHIYTEAGVYTVSLTVSDGSSEDSEIKVDYITVTLTSSQNVIIPIETKLYPNHPNPFNPLTNIYLDIKDNEKGILSIYNMKGQLIVSQQFEAGSHNFIWDASTQSSGIYLYKLIVSGKTVAVKKCLLLK